jgi:hypothetical protein
VSRRREKAIDLRANHRWRTPPGQSEPTANDRRRALLFAVKTEYLYSVSSRLINVRLDQQRLRKARKLKESGIALSDVVREAIDRRFEALRELETPRDVEAIMTRLLEQYPDPPDLPPRTYDVADRRAARAAIVRKLARIDR